MKKLAKYILKTLMPVALLLVLLSCKKQPVETNQLPIDVTPAPADTEMNDATETASADAYSEIKVVFINVGKADCTLVSYEDKNYLIDTGHVSKLNKVVQVLKSEGIESLDGIFITHIHSDHIGGLQGLFEVMDVKRVYFPDITDFDENGDNAVVDLCSQYDKELIRTKAGNVFALSDDEKVFFEVVGPITHSKKENDNSLVMYLNYYEKSILFAGDMQFTEEKLLMQVDKIHKVDILKAGNHGNADASSTEFVDIAMPEIVVVPTDKDIFAEDINDSILYLMQKSQKAYATNEFDNGIEFKLCGSEILTTDYKVKIEKVIELVEISDLNHKSEMLSLTNESYEDIDIGNWWIYSKKGDETYFIPKGTIIEGNSILTIASGDAPPQADLLWTNDNVWKKDDKAILYNDAGVAEAVYDLDDE